MRQKTKLLFKKLIASFELLSIELIIVLVAFISSLLTVVFFIRFIFIQKKEEFDIAVFDLLKPYVNDTTTAIMNFFTFFGGHYFLVPANLLLAAHTLFIRKNKWFAIRILSISFSSLILMFFLKYIFNRPRPLIPLLKEAQGLSFPSGHAFMSFAFFGLLIYTVYKEMKNGWLKYSLIIFFLLFTFCIGLSRIYLRVHYTSDVIAGFSLSLIWLVISLSILRWIEKYRTRLPAIQ